MGKVFIFLFFSVCLFGQVVSFNPETKVKLSSENTPSTFSKNSPVVYFNSDQYIVAWNDSRLGEETKYAQFVNEQLAPVGNNHVFKTDKSPVWLADNKFITTNFHTDDIIDPTCSQFIGSFFFSVYENNSLTKKIKVFEQHVPGCGVEWYGGYSRIVNTGDSLIVLMKFGKPVHKTVIDYNSNIIVPFDTNKVEFECVDFYTANIGNNYAVFSVVPWSNGLFYGEFFPDSKSNGEPTIIQMFNPDMEHSISSSEGMHRIVTRAVSDTSWLLVAFDYYTPKLTSVVVSTKGELLTDIKETNLPFEDLNLLQGELVIPVNMGLFEVDDNSSGIVVSYHILKQDWTRSKQYNSILYCDDTGNFGNDIIKDSSLTFNVGEKVHYSDGKLIATSLDEDDISIVRLDALAEIQKLRLNDDLTGSNDINPVLYEYPDGILVKYDTESISKTSLFGGNGTVAYDVYVGDFQEIAFSEDYKFATRVVESDNANYLYLDILDNSNESTNTIEVTSSENNIYTKLLSRNDSTFVLAYVVEFEISGLVKYNYDGSIVSFAGTEDVGVYSTLALHELDDDRLIVINSGNSQIFNNNLEALSAVNTGLYNNFQYAGGGLFCSASVNLLNEMEVIVYDQYGEEVVTINNDYGEDNDIATLLTGSNMNIIYKLNGQIVSDQVTLDGNVVYEQKLIHNPVGLEVQNIKAKYYNGNIFLVWQEAGEGTQGFDIAGKELSINDITDLANNFSEVSKYSLSQNYPNPFNPSTTVSFSLQEGSNVTFTVFDLLGREMMEKQGYYSSGNHSFKIDAGNWSTGVYFYKLETDAGFTSIRKMVLLK